MQRRSNPLRQLVRLLFGALLLLVLAGLAIMLLAYRDQEMLLVVIPLLLICLGGTLLLMRTRNSQPMETAAGVSHPFLVRLARLGLVLTRLRGRCTPQTAQLLYDSGVFLFEQCRYQEAAAKLQEAAGLFEELDDRQNQALALMELGSTQNAAGSHTAAIAALSKALLLWEQLSDRQREDNTWRLLNNLGVALTESGDFEAAESYCRRALHACREHHSETHPQTAMCLLNLADVHRRQKRFTEAEEILTTSLDILDRSKDENFTFAVAQLAMLHDDQGRFKEAEELYKQTRELMEKQFGPKHAELARVLERHGAMLERAGRSKEGAHLRAQAASIHSLIF